MIDPVLDEGCHHPSATGPAVAAGASRARRAPIFLHESFVHWDGWSLSAPRPGRSLGIDPSGPDPDRPETMPQHSSNDPLTQAGLRIETIRQAAQPAAAALRSPLPAPSPHRRPGRQRARSRRRRTPSGSVRPSPWPEPDRQCRRTGWPAPSCASRGSSPCRPRRSSNATPDRSSAHRLVVRSSTDEPALDVERGRVPAVCAEGQHRARGVARHVRRRDRLR